MTTFFLTCAALGGGILILQLLLGTFGFIDGVDTEHAAHDASEGLDLLSVRSLSAGLGFFGIGGLLGLGTGFGLLAAIPIGLILGFAAMVGTAVVTRWMLSLETDGSVEIHGAVGISGTVYLAIPGERTGAGKVMLTLQNRTVEYQAVTSQGPLPTGATVLVVDVVGPDTVDVILDPTMKELSHAV